MFIDCRSTRYVVTEREKKKQEIRNKHVLTPFLIKKKKKKKRVSERLSILFFYPFLFCSVFQKHRSARCHIHFDEKKMTTTKQRKEVILSWKSGECIYPAPARINRSYKYNGHQITRVTIVLLNSFLFSVCIVCMCAVRSSLSISRVIFMHTYTSVIQGSLYFWHDESMLHPKIAYKKNNNKISQVYVPLVRNTTT